MKICKTCRHWLPQGASAYQWCLMRDKSGRVFSRAGDSCECWEGRDKLPVFLGVDLSGKEAADCPLPDAEVEG